MKTLHTIYTNFAKRVLITLIALTTIGVGTILAAGETGTINFSSSDVKINAASVTAQDNLGNTWTITTVGTTSYTASKSYYQVGSSGNPATSITFTTTLPQSVNITNLSAKFGGFGDTAGKITLKVSETVVGSGNLNATNDVTVENTSTATGTVLTVTVTDIARGVKCYYISYTYEIDVPEYNVYWVANNEQISADVVEQGSRVTLPSKPADCSNNVVFVGWTAQNNVNGAKPSDLFNGSTPLLQLPTIDEETTFRAVYAEVVDGVGTFAAGESGTFKLYAIVNGNNYYASTGIDDRKLTSTTAIANAGDYTITHISDDQYTIQYDNQYISHVNGKVDLEYLEYNEENKSKCHWTITRTGTNGTWRVASPVNNDRALVFTTANNNSNVFKAYATENITADGAYYDLEIGNGEAISYQNYTTTCSTDVTVTLDPNGGTGDFSEWNNYTMTVDAGTEIALPELSKTGYNFDGWHDGKTTVASQYTTTKDITLTAQWTAQQYNIIYKDQGDKDFSGNHTTGYPTKHTYGTATTLEDATKTGYTFGDWYKESDCSGTAVTTLGATEYTENITLYAKWTPNTYTIQFDANEGTGEMEDQSFTYDAEPTALSANTFTRTGYNFTGWNTADDGSGTPYADKAEVQNLTATANGVVTLHAQWTAKNLINFRTLCTYNIEYTNLEGATHSNPETYTAANLPLEFTAPSAREGYTFDGWDPATLSAETRGDQEVEAQWTVNQYTVTWKLNGGQWQGGGTEDRVNNHNYGADVTKPVDPSRTGYTFTGWSPAEIPATMPAENLEFTAQWTPTPYTVTWKLGGIEYATSTVSIENPLSTATAPENPSDGELGCCADKFMGWSSQQSPSAGDIFTKDNIPANVITAKTYYAVFATAAQGVGTSIADFSEMGYENATAVTAPITLGDGEGRGDATITLEKAQSSKNDAKYYDDGAAVRVYAGGTITISSTYGGATIKSVTFEFSASDPEGDNTISVTSGDGTYSEGTWTGDATAVTFTIGGSTGHRRIASITVTTGVTGSQYTNYVTQCTTLPNPALSGGSVSDIAVDCGDFSTLINSQAIAFSTMQDLTCPVTFEVIEGDFLISTARDRAAQYQSKVKVVPYKTGENLGKLRNVYVRANATDHNEKFTGTLKVTSDEIADDVIIYLTATVTCDKFTLTTKNHLGTETVVVGNYFAGDVIDTEPTPSSDECTAGYTFDGWSTSEVEYGSVAYSKVTFPYTMPAKDVTLYPVYRINDTEDYHRVTSDLGDGDVDGNNWAGDYLIAYSDQIFADGRIGGLTADYSMGHENVKVDLSNYISNDIVSGTIGDTYNVALVPAEGGGYLLRTKDGKYNYYSKNTDYGLNANTSINMALPYALSIDFISKEEINLKLSGEALGSVFRYRIYGGNTYFRFCKDGATTNQPIYLYKKSPLYTTSLICGTIEIQENDIVVTSTKDQSVKVSVPVKLTSSYNDAVTISGANVNSFSVITKENVPVNTEEVVNVELVYSPQAYDQLDTETITLTATNGATTSFQITGRSLPETFAIVAKVGNIWYALPSQGLNSETTPVGYPVKVDNNDNPTAVTSLPTKAEWALRNVYKVNGPYDRFAANGENLVFVNAENKTLYASKDNANIQTYAEYTNYATTNPDRYEWVPTTTDLTNYTLKNVGRDKDLSINVNATFGTHASNVASSNLRFLLINATYTPFDVQVVEWYPTKVLVQTEAALTSVSATINGEAVASPVVTKKGGKLYEISGLPLENNPTKILTISYDSYSCSKVIPIIISRATKSVTEAPFTTLTTSVYNYSDLVVRDGAVLNITGAKNTPDKFVNVTIYPTAKIVVPENKQLSVYSLTFFGGISEIYNGSTYDTNKYGVPQLSLKGILGKTVSTIDYIMRVDLDQMYQVGVPYDVNLNEITYWDGTSIALGTALYVSAYDGAARARLDWDNTWQWEVNFAEKVLKAGIGYTISAEPQVAGDTYSILRMPMKTNINSGNTETQKATIAVTAHGMSDENLTDNHKGWNYLSNPYMTSISGAESGGVENNDIVVGYLVETGKGPWEWKNDTYRYVTIPYDDGTNYYQRKFSEATLLPFKSFFLQIANSGDLSFALASRLNAPMRHLQQQENAPREVEFELLLSNDAQSDNTGLLISEEFTPAYEINADLEKMTGTMSVYTIYNGYQLAYNALSPLNAMEEIPLGYVVPTTGEYTFNLDERGDLDDIEHIYLLDHDSSITTDLMEDIYTFTATEKKNDHRFAISVILKAEEEEETPTHLETLEWESDHPYKFIHQDKMYILRNGIIYDAMGKQVKTINK